MTDCTFCEIIKGTQKADILYEDDEVVAFRDIKPAAKFHILIIPKQHIQDARFLKPDQKELLEKLIATGKQLVQEHGLNEDDTVSGFHWHPFNSVRHLHLHYINPKSEMGFIGRYIFKPNTWWFVTTDYVFKKLEEECPCHSNKL